MKKRILVLLLTGIFLLAGSGAAAAAPTVNVDGTQLIFDVPPVVEDGRTLVPLSAIFKALGAEVQWDGSTQTVTATKAGTEIKLVLGQATAYKNGSPVTLSVPAKSISNRTMVPLAFVSDALGAQVGWDNSTQTASITTLTMLTNATSTSVVTNKTLTYSDGGKYVGETVNGVANGQGVYTSPSGTTCTGQFKDGIASGQCKMVCLNGDTYMGEFKNGFPDGQGTFTNSEGTTWTGEFKGGKANGQCKVVYLDGTKYTGELKDGIFNGQGTYIWPDGLIYAGEWKNGKRTGNGKYSRSGATTTVNPTTTTNTEDTAAAREDLNRQYEDAKAQLEAQQKANAEKRAANAAARAAELQKETNKRAYETELGSITVRYSNSMTILINNYNSLIDALDTSISNAKEQAIKSAAARGGASYDYYFNYYASSSISQRADLVEKKGKAVSKLQSEWDNEIRVLKLKYHIDE